MLPTGQKATTSHTWNRVGSVKSPWHSSRCSCSLLSCSLFGRSVGGRGLRSSLLLPLTPHGSEYAVVAFDRPMGQLLPPGRRETLTCDQPNVSLQPTGDLWRLAALAFYELARS
jgi:hypothetical protein